MKDVLVHLNNVFTTFVSEGVKPLIFGWKKFVKESYIFLCRIAFTISFLGQQSTICKTINIL